ncbi:MAG: peroxiredoxin [Bacteroidia bacterium]|jgi:peroxiredoxin
MLGSLLLGVRRIDCDASSSAGYDPEVTMKLYPIICLILALAYTGTVNATAQSTKISDFALLDHQGKQHLLSWYGDQKAVVVFIQGNGCPIARNSIPTLKALRDDYADQGVTFFMLNPQPQDNRESIAKEAREFDIDFPILVDETQLIAENLGVDRTSEIFIINPAAREVVFRGPIDDRLGYEAQKPEAKNHYLRDALDAHLAGTPIAANTPEAPGCLISFPARDAHAKKAPSYTTDVAPILIDKCVDCHNDGGVGPWSMSEHAMVQGWSRMMKEVLLTRRMPPGQIDPHVGKEIDDVVEMHVSELQTLVHWIDAGAPLDDGKDPLPELVFSDAKFTLGEPDIILKIPPQSIPATGILDYRYVPVTLNLDRDIWVKAVEYAPGDRKVLHHIITYLSSPADRSVSGRQDGAAQGESIGGFAPGRQPDIFRDNSGRLVRAGSNLLLQMHYTTSGKASVDASEIGIFIYDKPPQHIMSGGTAGQRRFLIPPHAKEHQLIGEQEIERDAYLYGLMPHMHYRGKYMNYSVEYPDGKSEMLLSVPKYDFNWQFNYQLKEPLFLPAGSKIIARGAMDNSDRNPSNPNPEMPVRFGLQTMHEMFFGFTTYRYIGDTPEQIAAERNQEESSDEVAGL